MHTATDKQVCQVAFTALNAPALREWYANVFGLVRAGRMLFFPPATSRVQGIPGAWEKCSWLIDSQDYFQLEFFQFWTPRGQLKSADWSPSDIGYNMVGIAVNDFDQVLRNIGAFSAIPAPKPVGSQGARRVCVTDPEGNWVEVFEQDPLDLIEGASADLRRPEVPALVRTVRVSVPSLEDARATFVDAMGLEVVDDFQLHTARDEKMWGLTGVKATSLVLRGTNFLLELVEYKTPQPRSWPAGYSLADQGIMNIALGYRDPLDYERNYARAAANGMRANGKVLDAGLFQVMYVNDKHGFSVEMLHARKALWSLTGFNPAEGYVENEIEINAPVGDVWRQLTDHAGIGNWSLFSGGVLRAGRPDPNGLGCIRELTAPGMRITEEVTAWDEHRHYAYQLRTGAPFRRHQGDVYVSGENGCTRVRWSIRFDSWIPGSNRIVSWLLGLVFRQALRKLKSRMETYQPESQF
ncbi:MAG: SRPBCC family protein [Pseudomonadales bacterium]|nr:SRPBCC family protein [Halioglobus sp.]MCP5120910.1 SRPBCC family protein [Pseudomonadales bacterium]MCP5194352.1 SRPBCC family protein [Pseudomonadales bacterium]